jgi:hypothetical protein
MAARSREKPCDDRPEAVGRMGGRLESVNMMWRPGPFEEAIDSGNRNRYGPRGPRTLFADKRYDVMSDRSGLSPRQIGIIEKIFGATVVLGDGEIQIGAHSHPVRDAVIRKLLSRIENERARRIISWIIAVLVYKPLAFLSDIMSHVGVERSRMPLSAYSGFSIARIQQDAYDRFFTKVEHRFSREMIRERFSAYWRHIAFSDIQPYWHFLCTGRKGDS